MELQCLRFCGQPHRLWRSYRSAWHVSFLLSIFVSCSENVFLVTSFIMALSQILLPFLIIIRILFIGTLSNTYISNNETFWRSITPFIPRNSSEFGHIRLWEEMSMSLTLRWNGRTEPSSGQYEQILRVGWPATSGGCGAQNSRYPSLWIDDDKGLRYISEQPIRSQVYHLIWLSLVN